VGSGGNPIARLSDVNDVALRRSATFGKESGMKKLITVVMFLLLALGYVACGGGYSSPTAPQQPSSMTPTPGPPPTPY
jgi:hypothetical protein